jgi:transglutaminase-like putative cysteine protease
MIAPRGLLGAALVAWGFAAGLPWLGAALAILVEAIRFSKMRLALGDGALGRILRFVFFAVFAALLYALATLRAPQSLYTWLRWLPIFVLPLPILQSLLGGMLRTPSGIPFDTTHAFAACCLIAAGTAGNAESWYFAAAFGVLAWALLARAPRRRIPALALLACAGILGFGVEAGLHRLQAQLEEWAEEFVDDFFAPEADPFRERTRIGDIGRIKNSDRIVMRVIPEGPRPGQVLLREAAFDRYQNGTWQSSNRTLRAIPRDGAAWRLRPTDADWHLVMRRAFPRGEGLLPLPAGTATIERLEAAIVEVAHGGAVRAMGVAGTPAMRIAYDKVEPHGADGAGDLELPEPLRPLLARIVAAENLHADTAAESAARVQRYFARGFAYTLQLGGPRNGTGRTIADFFERDRKGHCEYFATATVLLLRAAGVPARYAVGYSAQEFSGLEKAFLVRTRHAHAWSLALVDGRWATIDTTPANWAEQEAEAARSPWSPILDFVSWAWARLQDEWVHADLASGAVQAGGALLLVLLGLALWRLLGLRRAPRTARVRDEVTLAWRNVEERVARLGHPRTRQETVREWVARVAQEPAAGPWHASLKTLATAYYACRFDPACGDTARARFLADARSWTLR